MKKVILTKTRNQKKKISKNKQLFLVLFVCLIINYSLISFVIVPSYSLKNTKDEEITQKDDPIIMDDVSKEETIKEEIEQKPSKEPTIIVTLNNDLSVPFLSSKKVSDFIKYINGTIIDDKKIDTTTLGNQKVSFNYLNDEGIKVSYSFTIKVVDNTPPQIWLNSTKSITTEYKGKLLEDIVCADDLDDNPKCEIIGNYNTKVAGEYKLTFKATDKSGNQTVKKFTLKVKEPQKKENSSSSSSTTKPRTLISDVIKEHKNEKTKIGIDVSSWQGDIDFQKVKDAGVEFVYIRVGSTRGINGEYFVDKKFKRNIEGFNKVGIPVGIYFYSYANSKESAIQDANWVLNQIKGYKIDLPIAYDWESWSFYNEFNQSFYSLSLSAKAYLDTISNAGYKGILYSSKNYLEKVWYPIGYDTWLAHYTKKTSYQGDYSYWQLCSNGKIPGISGNVDINIYYE